MRAGRAAASSRVAQQQLHARLGAAAARSLLPCPTSPARRCRSLLLSPAASSPLPREALMS